MRHNRQRNESIFAPPPPCRTESVTMQIDNNNPLSSKVGCAILSLTSSTMRFLCFSMFAFTLFSTPIAHLTPQAPLEARTYTTTVYCTAFVYMNENHKFANCGPSSCSKSESLSSRSTPGIQAERCEASREMQTEMDKRRGGR